jgi:hypothetical protein
MKPDAEGEYVANIIEGKRDAPRSLPKGCLFKLYTMSPNSRYSIFVGFLCIALEAFLIFSRPYQLREADRTAVTGGMVVVGLLMLLVFLYPLLSVRRISRAIGFGINTMGRVERVQDARTGAYSTAAGMSNGAIRAMVAYTVNGQQLNSHTFLDRPWVPAVETGTELRLLVDPDKHSILYVVGIADQR